MFTNKSKMARKMLNLGMLLIMLLSTGLGGVSSASAGSNQQAQSFAVVFVSRKLSTKGSVYYPAGGIMPGVSGYSRFQVAAPGKLMIREANGTLRTLIDGSNPTTASLNLIDVNAPDVSYDGTKILFAGIVSGNYPTGPLVEPGAWRIYVINVDGTGLKQLTFSDRNIDLSQFGSNAGHFTGYDDTDPAWLPDGRIVFSSTRWPALGMYGAVRATNLHVINADGSGNHRITAEKNGADRPVIDPVTGKIVYSRWWRNFRTATDSMATIASPDGGYIMKDGLCAINHSGDECQEVGGVFNLDRNAWHLGFINPDGTGLGQFAGQSNTFHTGEIANHAYGGAFAPDGSFYANFFPMANGTEAAGFGGIKRFTRGPNGYTPIIGVTTRDESVQQFVAPGSYGVYVGNYAADPAFLPDGNLVISWAKDTAQDYGLYTINASGGNRVLLYDNPGTIELRARVIRPRTVPPIISDKVTKTASLLPPTASGPYDIDGSFQFQAMNVYFNAPVDSNIISAPPVGSANTIRFFVDHQRSQQRGSHETLDFPILLKEVLINPDGSVIANLPANVPLFEQIRSSQADGYKVPFTSGIGFPYSRPGAGHVAGLNYGRPGASATCLGCHAGHTMIPVPANPADAQWTNLAPGAVVTVSSLSPNTETFGLVDRRVKMALPQNNYEKYWSANSAQAATSQWAKLTFAVPVTVRTIRLYDIPGTNSKVLESAVRLYSDAAGTVEVASMKSGPLSDNGTNVSFPDVFARVVRVEINAVGGSTAGLAEVEVIARGEALNATGGPTATPTITETPTLTPTATATSAFTPTGTFTPTNMNTFTSTAINANTATATSAFTPTNTPPTFVPASPSSTFTPSPTSTPTYTPTNTATNTPTNTPTFTPTATHTSTPLPTSTNTPTSVAITIPSGLPFANVLDTFNRDNGRIGKKWIGANSGYRITSNELDVRNGGAIFWKANSFGKNQEVFVTLIKVDPAGGEIDLLLKGQNPASWGDGVIEVMYEPAKHRVQILVFIFPQDWTQCGTDIPVTFLDGDQFGARAKANGAVEVYRNGALIGSCDASKWSFTANEGYIGLWFIEAYDAVADNFGGGTIAP